MTHNKLMTNHKMHQNIYKQIMRMTYQINIITISKKLSSHTFKKKQKNNRIENEQLPANIVPPSNDIEENNKIKKLSEKSATEKMEKHGKQEDFNFNLIDENKSKFLLSDHSIVNCYMYFKGEFIRFKAMDVITILPHLFTKKTEFFKLLPDFASFAESLWHLKDDIFAYWCSKILAKESNINSKLIVGLDVESIQQKIITICKMEIKVKCQDHHVHNDIAIALQDSIDDDITCQYPWILSSQTNQSELDLKNDIIITSKEYYLPNLRDLIKTESIFSILDDVVSYCETSKLTYKYIDQQHNHMPELEKYKLTLPSTTTTPIAWIKDDIIDYHFYICA
eukprot:149722_1